MDAAQVRDIEDMVTAIVPIHERDFRSYSDPTFQYFQSFAAQRILREGRNIYMLFDTTACHTVERSILDELDLSARGVVIRGCEFKAFVRLMIDVREGEVVDFNQIDGNAQLLDRFIQYVLDTHRASPQLRDIELQSPLGFRKKYRLYYLKPAIKQKKHRASNDCLRQIVTVGAKESGRETRKISESLSGSMGGYLTEGAWCCKHLEAAKDLINAAWSDPDLRSGVAFSEYKFSTTTLSDLHDDVLAGIILFSHNDLTRTASLGRTFFELAAEQALPYLRNNELRDKKMFAFAVSYKHCLSKDWRNRIGYEQNHQLRLLLQELLKTSQRTGLGCAVAVWCDIALRVRVSSRYKFWPRYGLEPYARFTSIALAPKKLADKHGDRYIRTERVWLYLETFLANQSGGCIMLTEDGIIRRCRWRDDIGVSEALHNLAVHLLQHNVLWKRDATNWADKEAIQSWAYGLLGMGPGAWADKCGRLVNLMQVVEAEVATLPVYPYRERSLTRRSLESSWISYLLHNLYGTWLAGDLYGIRAIDKKFEDVSEGYRTTFRYHLTGEPARDEPAFLLTAGQPYREITAEHRSETFFWRRNQYEEFSLMFQRVYDPADAEEAILYRVIRLTGRSYIILAAALSQTAKQMPEMFTQIVGADRQTE